MEDQIQQSFNLLPFLIYFMGVLTVLGTMYGLSYALGQRHSGRETNSPYESGIKITGTARFRFSVKFYLVAILFVIFDLEVAFIFAWAVAARELGWPGYWAMIVFVAVVVAGLIYEWRMGALDWLKAEMSTSREKGDTPE